jgi:hypothetical protein
VRAAVLVLLLILAARAEDADSKLVVIPLKNGVNSVELSGDSKKDMVMVAHRENFNAHWYEATTIYILVPEKSYGPAAWNVVPVEPMEEEESEDKLEGERLHFMTHGGADCLLKDFRLLRDPAKKRIVVITAEREFGETFIDRQPVVFRYYELSQNTDGMPGSAEFYLKGYRKTVSKAPYCDVGEAFRKELGIARDGRHDKQSDFDD